MSSAIEDLTALPELTDITLLLRHHKSVTALSVAPTHSLSSVKSLLLAALAARGISYLTQISTEHGTIESPLTEDAEEVELGILVDKKDHSRGWKLLTAKSAKLTKKRKSAGAPSKSDTAGEADTIESLGLTDGSWLAYRIKQEHQTKPKTEPDGDVDFEIEEEADPGWDVVLPSFEEEVDQKLDEDDDDEDEDMK